jgi:bifunctional enzyme CysN/CysC
MTPRSSVAEKDLLRFATCGSVDDGKSTLIGRLLFDCGLLPDDQLDELRRASANRLTGPEGLDLSLLVDGLMAEREQNITIDVAYRFFETLHRRFIVADAPGHEQYTRNMVTAASRAGVAVVLVDARNGIVLQTRRHLFIAGLMGIRHIMLAVNKMDLVGYDRARFADTADAFAGLAASLGIDRPVAIPISALHGDNVCRRSTAMPWYEGPTLIETLESAEPPAVVPSRFRMPMQYVIRADGDFRGYAGLIVGGRIAVGDEIAIQPSGTRSRVTRIATFDGDIAAAASGQSVTLCLADDIDVSRGDVMARADQPPIVADQFVAKMIWMDSDPLYPGRSYIMRLAAATVGGSVTEIRHVVDMEKMQEKAAKTLVLNDVASVKIALDRPIAFDTYADNRDMGAFILIDRMTNRTSGAGLIEHSLRRGENIAWQRFDSDRVSRAVAMGHRPAIVWFTGLPGAGKSTIANLVERKLAAVGRHCYILDGDNVRHGLNRDLGFVAADRVENIRRVAEVARLMADAGLIVLVSFISPFARERAMAREIAQDIPFVEVFVDASLATCETRDPKGLYRKARSGAIVNFTGIDSPYEPPSAPDLRLDANNESAETLAELVFDHVQRVTFPT